MYRKIVWLILISGLLLRVAIVLLKPEVLWIDDTFYSLGIARNMASGLGWTHDGIHLTNGFQPLYVFAAVPFYWFLPKDGLVIPTIVTLFQSILSVITGYFLFRLIYERIGKWGALLGLICWSFSPYVIKSINGLETPINLFLIMLITYYYLERWRDRLTDAPVPLRGRVRSAIILGLLLGLLGLARIDSVVFIGALFVDLTIRMVHRYRVTSQDGLNSVKVLLVSGVMAALPLLAWFVLSYANTGLLNFDSGTANRAASIVEYDGSNIILYHLLALRIPLRQAVATALTPWVIHVAPKCWVLSMALIVFLSGLGVWVSGIGSKLVALAKDLGFLGLYGVLLMTAYVTYQFTSWMWPRYFYPLVLIGLICLGVAVESIFAGLEAAATKRRWSLRWVNAGFAVLCVAYVAALPTSVDILPLNPVIGQPKDMNEYTEFETVQWLKQNTPAGSVVGSFQSGILGYFSGRTVINLDGVVNGEAIPYIKDDNSPVYMKQAGIQYLADWDMFVSQQDFNQVPNTDVKELTRINGIWPFNMVVVELTYHDEATIADTGS